MISFANTNPIKVKSGLPMRSMLRLLKSVFVANVFILEPAEIHTAGALGSAIATTDDSFSTATASAYVKGNVAVAVKQLPANMIRSDAQTFFREVEPLLKCDRPHLVFDLSEVKCLDCAGVDVLLRCLQGASKRNGDLKLAAVPPELAAILEWSKAGRLFEIFENSSDAAQSFRQPRHISKCLTSDSKHSQIDGAQLWPVACEKSLEADAVL